MGRLSGTVRVPGDKSIGHRALMLAALAEGRSIVRGLGAGADLASTRRVLEALGLACHDEADAVVVEGVGLRGLRPTDAALDCGNSGTTMRLMTGILAGQAGRFVLDGDASLRRRPMRRVADVLAPLGADVRPAADGRPPVQVNGGPLRGATVQPPVASAQLKSAALLAGLLAEGPTTVVESGPSRDHTERMLGGRGVDLAVDGLRVTVRPPERLPATDARLPGDLSSAAFWLAACALAPGSDLRLVDVGLNPTRTGFLDVLEAMGAAVERADVEDWCGEPVGTLRLRCDGLVGADIGGELALRALDELPLVALLAATARGETRVRDAAELRVKESDRIAAMAEGLRALGARVDATPDGWAIEGVPRLGGGSVRAHDDHRVALAFTVAGLVADGPVILDDPACAAVSYPGFAAALHERWSTDR